MSESPGSGAQAQLSAEETTPVPSRTDHPEHHNDDPMDVTLPASAAMGPPMHSSPDLDSHPSLTNGILGEANQGLANGVSGGLSAAAATSSQQPKVVQTAFIHKLYRYIFGA